MRRQGRDRGDGPSDDATANFISTGSLPRTERVDERVAVAHARFR
jgi:hypothetical protein